MSAVGLGGWSTCPYSKPLISDGVGCRRRITPDKRASIWRTILTDVALS